jgi:hypothetical protein
MWVFERSDPLSLLNFAALSACLTVQKHIFCHAEFISVPNQVRDIINTLQLRDPETSSG